MQPSYNFCAELCSTFWRNGRQRWDFGAGKRVGFRTAIFSGDDFLTGWKVSVFSGKMHWIFRNVAPQISETTGVSRGDSCFNL